MLRRRSARLQLRDDVRQDIEREDCPNEPTPATYSCGGGEDNADTSASGADTQHDDECDERSQVVKEQPIINPKDGIEATNCENVCESEQKTSDVCKADVMKTPKARKSVGLLRTNHTPKAKQSAALSDDAVSEDLDMYSNLSVTAESTSECPFTSKRPARRKSRAKSEQSESTRLKRRHLRRRQADDVSRRSEEKGPVVDKVHIRKTRNRKSLLPTSKLNRPSTCKVKAKTELENTSAPAPQCVEDTHQHTAGNLINKINTSEEVCTEPASSQFNTGMSSVADYEQNSGRTRDLYIDAFPLPDIDDREFATSCPVSDSLHLSSQPFDRGEQMPATVASMNRHQSVFIDDHSSCVRKLPTSWPERSANSGAALEDAPSLSRTLYTSLSALNGTSDASEQIGMANRTAANVMSVMIPNPFTIQHGLQQTFDFAAFRPVSPPSRREGLDGVLSAQLTHVTQPRADMSAMAEPIVVRMPVRKVTGQDQRQRKEYAPLESRLKVELTKTMAGQSVARDKIAVSDTKLSMSKQSPRPLRRVFRSKSGKQRKMSTAETQNPRAKINAGCKSAAGRSALGCKMERPSRADHSAAGGETPKPTAFARPPKASGSSLLDGRAASPLSRVRRQQKTAQTTPWLQQALKGTLARWEEYLTTPAEQMYRMEVENAEHFNFNATAKAVIEDRDLHIWQLLDDMSVAIDRTSLDNI